MYQKPKDSTEIGIKTVTLSDFDLRAVVRLLRLLLAAQDGGHNETNRIGRSPIRSVTPAYRSDLIEHARHMLMNRSRRSQHFNSGMFGEPAWDMLLALYVGEQTGTRYTVTRLTDVAGVPSTTALRWLDFLEKKERMVIRKPNPTDRRISLIELTDRARGALDVYFSDTVATQA